VRHVAQPESYASNLKMVRRKRQLLGVGLDEADAAGRAAAVRLGNGAHQHFAAKIGPDDARAPTPGAIVSQSQVDRTSAKVVDWRGSEWPNQARRSPAPVFIDVEAQEMVQQVVPGRHLTEHPANARLALVEERSDHGHLGSPSRTIGILYSLRRTPSRG